MRKRLIIILAILAGIASTLYCASYKFQNVSNEKHEAHYKYQYDLAILNKSFKRDLGRSEILYRSFEKYFLNAENVPFFIVVPLSELELFKTSFQDLQNKGKIKNLPHFLTEQEVLQRCGEPDITYNGGWTQQVVKLCFGITNIAKNYIMMDSDNYFTKPFDPKILYEGDTFKTVAWKLPGDYLENTKKQSIPWFTDNKFTVYTTAYKNMVLIKDFFGNKDPRFFGFVISPCFFNSNALHRMQDLMEKKGGYKFSMLIRIVPFEMQWYGEYMLQNEHFVQGEGLFKLISSPDECAPEDGGFDSYGLWFQSVIYDYGNIGGDTVENTQYIYKRPTHCDKVSY